MSINGFKLTYDDGTVFRCSANVDVSHGGTSQFLLDGLGNTVSLFNSFIDQGGQAGRADSNFASVFAGFGAGAHTIEVRFEQTAASNNTDTWGDTTAASADDVIELRDRLTRALTTKTMGSQAPGDLEVGEYSDSGIYDPIPVAPLEWNIEVQVIDPDPSIVVGSISFGEAADLSIAIDGQNRGG